jgi:hypothetical protein
MRIHYTNRIMNVNCDVNCDVNYNANHGLTLQA